MGRSQGFFLTDEGLKKVESAMKSKGLDMKTLAEKVAALQPPCRKKKRLEGTPLPGKPIGSKASNPSQDERIEPNPIPYEAIENLLTRRRKVSKEKIIAVQQVLEEFIKDPREVVNPEEWDRKQLPKQSLTLDKIWQQLLKKLNKATYAGQMSLEVVGEPRATYRELGSLEKSISLGSMVRLKIDLDSLESRGHLLLLDKGTAGKIYCLCPSLFATNTDVEPKQKISLPQENSPINAFPVTGNIGQEELLGVVTKEAEFDWLPEDGQGALVLETAHLNKLLKYLNEKDGWTVLYKAFTISIV